MFFKVNLKLFCEVPTWMNIAKKNNSVPLTVLEHGKVMQLLCNFRGSVKIPFIGIKIGKWRAKYEKIVF